MSVIYVLVPLSLLLALSAVAGFIWAVRNGQMDDLESPANQLFAEDNADYEPS